MTNKKQGSIVLFPRLFERHLELAMEARDQGNLQKAREHLEQAVQLEKDDPSVTFGLMVTYFELGMFGESQQLAEKMLHSRTGEMHEVMHLYLITLIQQEKYDQVCEFLLPILDDPELPDPIRTEFAEILHSCQLLSQSEYDQDGRSNPLLRKVVHEKLQADPGYLALLLGHLRTGEAEKQWQAIQQLKYTYQPEASEAIHQLISQTETDSAIKTFGLYALKELGWSDKVDICKFGKTWTVDLELLPDEDFFVSGDHKIVLLLAEKMGYKDPSFISFAFHLWGAFLYACYPETPVTRKEEAWSASLHFATKVLLAQPAKKQEIANLYHLSVATLSKNYKILKDVLKLESGKDSVLHYLPPGRQ
ncbi:tetratricopeptide repeat protein [Ammoniphilus sp. 3BR4]|uniref:tetratricopeptide repeat protein n=1 Tax=Ammoniphilus sp. 3BR4 TaxID=3158265 RepID=UPI0034650B19